MTIIELVNFLVVLTKKLETVLLHYHMPLSAALVHVVHVHASQVIYNLLVFQLLLSTAAKQEHSTIIRYQIATTFLGYLPCHSVHITFFSSCCHSVDLSVLCGACIILITQ